MTHPNLRTQLLAQELVDSISHHPEYGKGTVEVSMDGAHEQEIVRRATLGLGMAKRILASYFQRTDFAAVGDMLKNNDIPSTVYSRYLSPSGSPLGGVPEFGSLDAQDVFFVVTPPIKDSCVPGKRAHIHHNSYQDAHAGE